ncbi:MAG: DUF4382 domain-containing protein [Steroidobacteraceae bacterium]
MRVVGSRLAWRFKWLCAPVLGTMALLAGCSYGSNIIYGTPVITIGDVSGDFSSYIVEIDEITFTRNDGLVVEPLATTEEVDLAKLSNMTELLEAPAFPYGTYTSMTLILDYTSPNITVDVGGTVEPVAPVDTTGEPMSATTVTVNFDAQHPLVISPNQSTAFAIDIDLAAMNTLNLTANPMTVTVQPFMSASVVPVAQTGTIRARGLTVVSDPTSGYYIMNIRPFADLVSALGALTVNASATTYFNINGHVFVGNAGLQTLTNTNLTNTPAVAYGTLDDLSGITPTFNATAVYVGTSEESELADYVTGTVSAISGDTLTIKGTSYLNRYGELFYYNTSPVTIASDTPVFEDGVAATGLGPKSISIGQQVAIGGQATTNSSTGDLISLDATEGLVRLQPTQLWGTLNSATTGSISLDLLSIENFEPAEFNFTGTGSTAADDAVASSYGVDTGALNESALAAGSLLQVNGLVTPLGTAPPDFTATSVTQASTLPSKMVFEFGSNGAAVADPFLQLSTGGIVMDFALADSIHYIQNGPNKINLTSQAQVPTVTFASGTTLILAVGTADTEIDTFNEAASFVTEIEAFRGAGDLVYRVVCVGQYNAATNTFVATKIDVALVQPA